MHMYITDISEYICITLEWVCHSEEISTWFNIPIIYRWFHLLKKSIGWKISNDIPHILQGNKCNLIFKKQSTNKSTSRYLHNLGTHVQ